MQLSTTAVISFCHRKLSKKNTDPMVWKIRICPLVFIWNEAMVKTIPKMLKIMPSFSIIFLFSFLFSQFPLSFNHKFSQNAIRFAHKFAHQLRIKVLQFFPCCAMIQKEFHRQIRIYLSNNVREAPWLPRYEGKQSAVAVVNDSPVDCQGRDRVARRQLANCRF